MLCTEHTVGRFNMYFNMMTQQTIISYIFIFSEITKQSLEIFGNLEKIQN